MIDFVFNLLYWLGLIMVFWFGSAFILYHAAIAIFSGRHIDPISAVEQMVPWILLGPFSSYLFYVHYQEYKKLKEDNYE